jgi:hypothetical protein
MIQALNAGGSTANLTLNPSGGSVGIGTTTPGALLHVYQAGITAIFGSDKSSNPYIIVGRDASNEGGFIQYNSSGQMSIGELGSGASFYVDGSNAAFPNLVSCGGLQTNGSGVLSCTSDERLKDIQSNFTTGLSAISKIIPQTYSWKASSTLYDNGILYSGFIAQNISAAIPEAVSTSTGGYLQVNTTAILAASINAIKELDGRTSFINNVFGTSTLLTVATSGYIGIGSTNPTSKLEVKDTTSTSDVDVFKIITNVDSSDNVKFRIDSDGDIFTDGSVTIGTPADIAEAYPSIENDILPGMLVAFTTSSTTWSPTGSYTDGNTYTLAGIVKATSSSSVIGVVSTNPGITLGKDVPNATPVAFMGRIPVLVTNEHGSIEVGDLLTLSTSTPGYATKLTGNSTSIGRALSAYTSTTTVFATSTILLYVDIKDSTLTLSSLEGLSTVTSTISTTTPISPLTTITNALRDGVSVVTDFVTVKITALYAYVDTLFAREVRAEEKVCIGNTCINESDLQQFIQYKNQMSAPSSITPSPQTSSTSTQDNASTTNSTSTIELLPTNTSTTTDQISTSTTP